MQKLEEFRIRILIKWNYSLLNKFNLIYLLERKNIYFGGKDWVRWK